MGTATAETRTVAWSLRATDGRIVTPHDLAPKWLLVYFGYTYCPDLCPSALLDIAEILRGLGAEATRIQPVFISIDPERDTPENLARYLESFEAPILGLTGADEEIASAARQFAFHYVRYRDPSLAGDSFDHTSSFFLVDAKSRLRADFATELPPAEIAAGIRDLLLSADGSERAATVRAR